MTVTEIRLKTGCIVERDGEYLVGYDGVFGARWSNSPYDAWITRDKMEAFQTAWSFRGRVMLFNPIVGRTAPMKMMAEGAGIS